jgi:23S rRNA (cytidine1920-2'-O)/16S rRNA (cytidine1409-2'-O)-methyltransferase
VAEKIRLDVTLHERGFVDSREKAKALIMAGLVYVNDQKQTKAGFTVKEGDCVELRGEKMPFVSRGGYKLKKAVDEFGLVLADSICMDIGASTGGFTDCMLQSGAKKVYSIDVGYGQLAWKLRQDERVVNMERTNIRHVTSEQIGEKLDFASIDVSFISLKLVLPVAAELLKEDGQLVALIKPQFEAGREQVGKKGVVRDSKVHEQVITNVSGYARDAGFYISGLAYSPVRGPEGNIEYLAWLTKTDKGFELSEQVISELVAESHNNL